MAQFKQIGISLFIVLTAITSCNVGKKNSDSSKSDDNANLKNEAVKIETAYFKASGTESSWSLSIDTTSIKFLSHIKGIEKITVPHVEAIRAMDANVKMYNLQTENVSLQITIIQKNCINDGKQSPYGVTIRLKRNHDKDFTELSGCGHYITDYRLYDIWALQEINGKVVTPKDFEKEIPYIEINTNTNTFMGYAGCNNLNGKLFSERDLLRFTDIAMTLKLCSSSKEDLFLEQLHRVTSYQLNNGRLFLKSENKPVLIFKKVD